MQLFLINHPSFSSFNDDSLWQHKIVLHYQSLYASLYIAALFIYFFFFFACCLFNVGNHINFGKPLEYHALSQKIYLADCSHSSLQGCSLCGHSNHQEEVCKVSEQEPEARGWQWEGERTLKTEFVSCILPFLSLLIWQSPPFMSFWNKAKCKENVKWSFSLPPSLAS